MPATCPLLVRLLAHWLRDNIYIYIYTTREFEQCLVILKYPVLTNFETR